MTSSAPSVPAVAGSASAAAAVKVYASSSFRRQRSSMLSSPFSQHNKPLFLSSKGLGLRSETYRTGLKAQLNAVTRDSSHNDSVLPPISEPNSSKEKSADVAKKDNLQSAQLSDEGMREFMNQVSDLIKLVDSKDIVELQVKQDGCELIIRKKEALPQPPPVPAPSSSPFVTMYPPPPVPTPMPPPPPPVTTSLAPTVSPAQRPLSTAGVSGPKSSHPPLKSPMAGTFYRSPAPGTPPFVKIGDKVNEGQILCIIEAMKLMNEIEADRAGTVVEILVDDGKPVGFQQPIFVIEP